MVGIYLLVALEMWWAFAAVPQRAPLPPLSWEGGWTSYQVFKKGGLAGSQFLEGYWWERRGGWPFSGGATGFLWGSLKNPIFRGFTKKLDGGGNCLKRGAWIICRSKRGLGEKEGVVFLKGRLIPQSTLYVIRYSLTFLEWVFISFENKFCVLVAAFFQIGMVYQITLPSKYA